MKQYQLLSNDDVIIDEDGIEYFCDEMGWLEEEFYEHTKLIKE